MLYSVSELQSQRCALLICVLFINVGDKVVLIDSESTICILNVDVKLVLQSVIVVSAELIFLIQSFDLSHPVVRNLGLFGYLLLDSSLSIDEHVSIGICASEHLLESSRHDWLHSAIIEVKEALAKFNIGVREREIAH